MKMKRLLSVLIIGSCIGLSSAIADTIEKHNIQVITVDNATSQVNTDTVAPEMTNVYVMVNTVDATTSQVNTDTFLTVERMSLVAFKERHTSPVLLARVSKYIDDVGWQYTF